MHKRIPFLLALNTGILFVSSSVHAEETPEKPSPYLIGFPTLPAPVLHAPLLTPMPVVLQSGQSLGGSKPAEVWYGWQSLIGVLACDSLIVVGLAVNANSSANSGILYTMASLGVIGRVMTPPIVHWAHGHVRQGFVSLGVNVGMPVVVGLIGVGIGVGGDIQFAPIVGGVLGLMIGAVGATVIDTTVLSTEPVTPSIRASNIFNPSNIAIVPMFDRKIAGLSLVGQF